MIKYIAFSILLFTSISHASNNIDEEILKVPDVLISTLSKQLIAQLSMLKQESNNSIETRAIVENTLMPHVDTNYAAYTVLGKHLKKATKLQRKQFHQYFSRHLISTYAGALAKFNNQKVQVQPLHHKALLKRKVSVKAKLIDGSKPAIDIYFKLRKDKKSGYWKVYDLVAEGISLIHTKRAEFSQLINQVGINGAITYLKEA